MEGTLAGLRASRYPIVVSYNETRRFCLKTKVLSQLSTGTCCTGSFVTTQLNPFRAVVLAIRHVAAVSNRV